MPFILYVNGHLLAAKARPTGSSVVNELGFHACLTYSDWSQFRMLFKEF